MAKEEKSQAPANLSSMDMATASFDSELDSLFQTAASSRPKLDARTVRTKRARSSTEQAKPEETPDDDKLGESEEEEEDWDPEEDIERKYSVHMSQMHAQEQDQVIDPNSDSDSNAEEPLIHETLLHKKKDRKASKKDKGLNIEVPQAEKDLRSLFIGNLPVSILTSRPKIKDLKRHLISYSPYPSITRIESIRFRSIPFAKPTEDFDARNPSEAEQKARKRQRTAAYKEAHLDASASEKKTFLTGSQKRKVAFITQKLNEKADSINAYVTLSPFPQSGVTKLQEVHGAEKTNHLTPQVLTSLLAAMTDETVFQERHLRVDLVNPLQPSDIVESGLDKVRTSSGDTLGASVAKSGSSDHESRKRSVFVGNMEFETKEEELREFFQLLLEKERGPAPVTPRLDFSQCSLLPEPSFMENVNTRGSSWVQGVRIIRDGATQMGKGFGYVKFLDAICVDEIIALFEEETTFLEAIKSGKKVSTEQIRRKFKLKGRPLRVSRCKVPRGNVTSSSPGVHRTPRTNRDSPHSRSRSTGAPTPGGTSPFAKYHKAANDSPSRAGKRGIVANPKPLHSDPHKIAQINQKKADPARQARRLNKKNAKRTANKALAIGEAQGKEKVTLKTRRSSKGSQNTKKKPSLASRAFAALSLLAIFLTAAVLPVQANNEIVNFGPTLCPADELGHLDDRAAREVSRSWPHLRPSSRSQLFSVSSDLNNNGVWLVLDLESEQARQHMELVMMQNITTPQQLSSESFPLLTKEQRDRQSPRDWWLQSVKHRIVWLFSYVYSLRINWAANFPLHFEIHVYTPAGMLAAGQVHYEANSKRIIPSPSGSTELRDKSDGPIRKGVDWDRVDMWPCPRLYVHIKSTEDFIVIPSDQLDGRGNSLHMSKSWVLSFLAGIAEAYIGPLNDVVKSDTSHEKTPIPIHIILDPMFMGVLPHTSFSLFGILIPLLCIGYFWLVPFLVKVFESGFDRIASTTKTTKNE